jgi:hypothetical protein
MHRDTRLENSGLSHASRKSACPLYLPPDDRYSDDPPRTG